LSSNSSELWSKLLPHCLVWMDLVIFRRLSRMEKNAPEILMYRMLP
jgi:hypothetical protein